MNGYNGLARTIAWRRRWPAARRALRRLPEVAGGPERIEAILALTADADGAADETAGDDGTAGSRSLRGWRRGGLAAAAAVIVAAAGVWAATALRPGPDPSEVELARLDAEVEMVLVRLGRIMQRTEHIALDDVLRSDTTTNQ